MHSHKFINLFHTIQDGNKLMQQKLRLVVLEDVHLQVA